MSAPRLRAWVYIRESKVELLRGYSPDEMVGQCRTKVGGLGADVTRVIVEAGKRDELDCPGLLEAIDAAKRGEYDIIVSYDMYRLSGELFKHLWVKGEFARTRVSIHYVVGEYPDTAEGELMETVQAGVGRYERVKTRMRTQNGITGKLKREQPICNGVAPYGLEKVYDERTKKPIDFEATPEISVLYRIVRELQEPKGTLLAVCAGLNADGIPTPSGKGRWASGTILSLLDNATYTGTYEWGRIEQTPGRRADGSRVYTKARRADEEIRSFGIPYFIDPAEVAAARAAMARRRQVRRPRRPAEDDPFVLRGLVTCGHCGGALSCTVNNGYRRYTCLRAYGPGVDAAERCPLPQVAAEALEDDAWARVKEALDRRCLRAEMRAASDADESVARHRRQVETARRAIAATDLKITNAVDVQLENPKGSVAHAYAQEKQGEAERTKLDLEAALARLEASAPRVLSADGIAAVMAFVDEYHARVGADGETAAGRRSWLARLDVRGTVGLAEGADGLVLGRKHRFAVAWKGSVRLSGSCKHPQETLLLLDSQAGVAGIRVRTAA